MVLGFFNSPKPYKAQKYDALKRTAQKSGQLFTDPEFPANEKALFTANSSSRIHGIEWKRPKDICEGTGKTPKLIVEGVSGNDLNQGAIGNCWFVAACSSLAQKKEVWRKVIPNHKEQEWNDDKPDDYAGIFHFCFWRYGEWIDVVVDDLLPTKNNQLVFVHSKSENEFWSALLEKAYAKVFGNYEALDGGELSEALEDFTGGIAEPIDMAEENYADDEEKRNLLFKNMKKEISNGALLAAAIPARSSEEMEQSIDVGLVKGHAYGITAVKNVLLEGGSGLFNMFNRDRLHMVRLRNPWGGTEWKGRFSDDSEEWNKIDNASKEKIGLTKDEDGEFWMLMDDYCRYFTNMSICRVVNTHFFALQKQWVGAEIHGEWQAPNRAGGCINNKETFLKNPQIRFDIEENEDEILLGLTQKTGRGETTDDKKTTIGFTIMKVEFNRRYRTHKLQEVVKSSTFKNSRSIFLRHTFPKGRYIVIPCTFEAGQLQDFMMRIYTSAENKAKELKKDVPKSKSCSTLCGCILGCRDPVLITRIKVLRAAGLENQDIKGGADPYLVVKCENENIQSQKIKDTLNPEWKASFIFFRKKPQSNQITIEVWNDNTLIDAFMGQHELSALDEVSNKVYELDLFNRKKGDERQRVPGKLYVEVTTTRLMEDH